MKIKSYNPIRIGILGLGFGASVHAPALLGLSDVEVVGIAGRSANKAQKVANKIGIAVGCGSVDELLELGLDALTLAIPPDQIKSVVNSALAHRVPILCEKPLGDDAVSSMSLAQDTEGLTTGVDFLFAEMKVFADLKQIIDSCQFGKVRHANLLWLNESWSYRGKIWSWKTDSYQHGGVLSLFGSHIFYLTEWLFGRAKRVHASMLASDSNLSVPKNSRLAEDVVSCHFQLETGSFLNCTFGNANPGISIHRWTVVFDDCTIIVENNGLDYTDFKLIILKSDAKPKYSSEMCHEGDGRIIAFRRIARRFIDAVINGSSFQPDFKAGARVQYIDNNVRISAQTNKSVNL